MFYYVSQCVVHVVADVSHVATLGFMLEFCFYFYVVLLHCTCIVLLYVCHLPLC